MTSLSTSFFDAHFPLTDLPAGLAIHLFPIHFSPSEPYVVATDDRGMIVDDGLQNTDPDVRAVRVKKPPRKKRQPIKYVSRHFTEEDVRVEKAGDAEKVTNHEVRKKVEEILGSTTAPAPRIYYGLNVDELSSDSSLTDIPDGELSDPFSTKTSEGKPELQAVKTKSRMKNPSKSPYFPHPHRYRSTFLSTLPFPPLSDTKFGLMQERLAHDPFRLLIATIFLNKTPGERAMPVFYELMQEYPTPEALSKADVVDVTAIIHHLGFQNQRARKCVAMAQAWVARPPAKGKRYRKLNYPAKGNGRDVKEDEVIDDEDERVAWEISHLPGLGPYSHDSWRMFCRDRIRGLAESWQGEGAVGQDFEPEWKRVVPTDKELRAYLTWMWLKEGYVWNKETGQRIRADEELMERARGGGVVLEEREKNVLTIQDVETDVLPKKVEVPAGEFLDEAVHNQNGVLDNMKLS